MTSIVLSVLPRRSDKLHFTPPLKLYIQTIYNEDAGKYASDLASLEALRDEMLAGSTADVYLRYRRAAGDAN